MSALFGTICGMVVTLLCGFQSKPHPDDVTWICKSEEQVYDSFSISLSKDWQPVQKDDSADKRTAIGGKFVSNRKATMEIVTFAPKENKQELWDSINDMVKTFSDKTPERIRIIKQGEETITITFLPTGVLPYRSGQRIAAARTNFRDRYTLIEGFYPESAKVDELVEIERAVKTIKILP